MERLAPVLTSADFTFEFQEPPQLPNPMLAIRDASFGYRGADYVAPDASNAGDVEDFSTSHVLREHQLQTGEALADVTASDTVILRNVDRSVLAGQRIGVLGANGQGKSTFVKTIAHALPLLAGRITEGKGLRLGYFAQQELDVLQLDDTPLGHMIRLAKAHPDIAAQAGREQDLRNFLGSFQFSGDRVSQRVGSMSGGEKARLVLAMIVWQRPNLLLLDEPTNHLDLATREALSMALNEFEGTVMLVSHDRALLRAVCDEFWLVGRGQVGPFDGDLDDYQRYLLEESKRLREQTRQDEAAARIAAAAPATPATEAAPPSSAAAAPVPQIKDSKEQRRLDAQARQQLADKARPLKKELEQIDKRLATLAAERAELETRLTQPLPPAEIADCGKRLKQGQDETEKLEERWLEISAALEDMGASSPA